MAIAKVQGVFNNRNAGTPVVASFTNTPTSGNLLIAAGWGATAQTNASITGWTMATWTKTAGANWEALFYKVAGASESKDVSLAWTGSSDTALIIEEWGGFTGTPTLDKIADVDTDGTDVTSRSSGTTAATSVAAELCIAQFGMNNTVTAQSWSNSFTEEKAFPVGALQFFVGSLIVAATGTYETTLSWTTGRKAGGLIATFMGVSAATWTPKVIMVT